MINEEEYIRKRFDMKILEDEQLEALKAAKEGKKLILSISNYEILNNPAYANRFSYIPEQYRDTEQEFEQSDKVISIVFLSYMAEEKQQQFNFKNKLKS